MVLKELFINGCGSISIQNAAINECIFSPINYSENYVRCIEPNFKDYLDPIAARRMSRIIKRAIVSAKNAVKESGLENVDAIITGTGLGCVEDTEKFLEAMITNDEKFLQPTYFIQSTHNTISSQIAIHMKCHGYNNTYIHRGTSFENALMDAVLLFNTNEIHTALVTGNDELTPKYFTFLRRLGYWKNKVDNSLKIIENNNDSGSFAGEGSVSIVFSDKKSNSSYAKLLGMDLFFKQTQPIEQKIEQFLAECGLSTSDVSVYMTGMNGDKDNDAVYSEISNKLFSKENTAFYKNICGEYYTSGAFGVMATAYCLQQKQVPAHMMLSGNAKKDSKYILLHNHFRNKNHSLLLLGLC